MTIACVVRPAVPGDLDTLVALCAEHAEFERAVYDPAGKRELLHAALFGAAPRLSAWIATVDADVVGYATAASEFSTWQAREFLHMDCLFVRAGWRNAGIGVALMNALIADARMRGYAEVQWQTPSWNEAGRRFYLRQGAVENPKLRFSLPIHG